MSKSVEKFTEVFGSLLRSTSRVKSQVSNYQGIDFTGLRLLSYLISNGPTRLSELAEKLLVDPAIITRQSHALIDGGFVIRKVNPSDARGSLLEITESGILISKQHHDVRSEFFQNVFDDWSQEEINQFNSYMERFTKALNEKAVAATSQHKIKQER
ncbi:MAG: hypothetical protein RLZZ330_282 [Actinomycetota bacterium]|jgi:DNA-binding MarR family transcriptional regulator